jgi:hypothetical protein
MGTSSVGAGKIGVGSGAVTREELLEALFAQFRHGVTLMCAEMVAGAKRVEPLPPGEFAAGYALAQQEFAAMLRMVARDEIPVEVCREVHRREDPPAEATPR